MIVGGRKRPGGYAHWFNGGEPDIERDSVTCCHCNRVVFIEPLKPVEDFTGWCMCCMKFTCTDPRCAACTPFERTLDQMERRAR